MGVDWSLIAQWIATVAAITFGAEAWRRARRADARAAAAEILAKEADARAARSEERELERADVRWEYGFVTDRTFQVVNRGLDVAGDVVILVRFDQAWDEARVAQMTRNAEVNIATPAGVEANHRMATELRDSHRRGGPAWAPEVTVSIELRIIWRTPLGNPRIWESGDMELQVPMSDAVVQLNAASEHVGRMTSPW